jgi:hypothetical protein
MARCALSNASVSADRLFQRRDAEEDWDFTQRVRLLTRPTTVKNFYFRRLRVSALKNRCGVIDR